MGNLQLALRAPDSMGVCRIPESAAVAVHAACMCLVKHTVTFKHKLLHDANTCGHSMLHVLQAQHLKYLPTI
jgi:hypothetical protein